MEASRKDTLVVMLLPARTDTRWFQQFILNRAEVRFLKGRLRFETNGIPEERKYPIPDASHARNALARVAQNGTPTEKRRVRAAVRRKFPSIKVNGK